MKKVISRKIKKSRLTFNEANKFLKGYFDLDKELQKALRIYNKWGLTRALIKSKLIKNTNEFSQLFSKARLKVKNLQSLISNIKNGGLNYVCLFVPPLIPGKFDLGDLYKVLFENKQITYHSQEITERILHSQLNEIKEISLKSIPWNVFKIMSLELQSEVLKKIYTQSKQKPSKPRIIFTSAGIVPDRHTRSKNSLATDLPLFLANKIQLIDPGADFILRRIQNDNIKKYMPSYGNSIATIYFVYILPNGRLVGSQWDRMPDRCFKLSLNDWFLPQEYSGEENFGLRTII